MQEQIRREVGSYFSGRDRSRHYVTVKLVAVVAVPLGVVITIFPVFAPVGTVAFTCVSDSTVKVVAFTPPKVTWVVCLSPTPLMVTSVPTRPLVGLKLV